MTTLFALEPEVAGEWGPSTIISNESLLQSGEATMPEISYLEYQFDTWSGDSLLQCEGCYIVTQQLANMLRQRRVEGSDFDTVAVSVSEIWKQLNSQLNLPPFERLLPVGKVEIRNGNEIVSWSGHDVCWGQRVDYIAPKELGLIHMHQLPYSLVVTEDCLMLLRSFQLTHCEVEELVLPVERA